MKNAIGIWIGTALNLQVTLGSIVILTNLILLIHEHSSMFFFIVWLHDSTFLQLPSYASITSLLLSFGNILPLLSSSLVAQMVKRLPTMWETRVQSLGWEDTLEKEMAIHSSTIAWKIPWTGEPGRLQSMGSQRVGHNWATSLSLSS